MSESNHDFELIRDEHLEEYKARARLYRHRGTGTELLSIICDDENKVFGITFRTPPSDSTGVAHILEHSVLCGSRKFPTKEPFVELLKGSLQTFLNAFTYPDKTCYPVASQNLSDFYNLIDVYMDAALNPLLEKHTFDQEAWHHELESRDGPLSYKGVVFNEMKGVYASSDSLLMEHSQRILYPDITYGLDYGGDPRRIPDLTWEALRAFHNKFYHPSNARIYFYGDDDPETRLRIMNAWLSHYDHAATDSDIPLQPPERKLPAKATIPYPADAESETHTHLTINWRLHESGSVMDTMGMLLLDHILTETPASPLRKALIESGLGEDLAGTGLETQLRELYFSTGLKGITPGQEMQVVGLIEKTLAGLVEHGLDPLTIEAALNTEEFNFRELNTGNFPRGLSLMISSLQTWLYGGDPLAPLRYQKPLDQIRSKIASGERYFEDLIEQRLIQNPHRSVLIMVPDPALKQRLDDEEHQRLAQERATWDAPRVEETISNTAALRKRQATPDSPEVLKCLPGLARADLPPKNKTLPIEATARGKTPVLFHELFTQGITYVDVGFNLDALPAELLVLVPVWARAVLETGTMHEDYVSLTQRIGRLTGGIDTESYTSSLMHHPGYAAWYFLRGKALDPRLPDLFNILGSMLTSPRLDLKARLREIIAEEKAEVESGVIPSGHRFVSQRLHARFNASDLIQEKLTGLSYLFSLRKLRADIDKDWAGLQTRLQTVHEMLVSQPNMIINVTSAASARTGAEKEIDAFLARLPDRAGSKGTAPAPQMSDTAPEGLIIPAQVNYVGKAINLKQLGHEVTGHSLVVSRYLRSAWLWDQVRVQGGAYGGFCMTDYRSGQFAMVSYRDPNLLRTLDVYDRTACYLQELDIDEEEVTRAVIGAIGDMDGHLLPDAKGFLSMCRYLAGDTDNHRQRIRDEILKTSLKDFRTFGEQLEAMKKEGRVVVMGSRENLLELPGSRNLHVL